MHGRPRNFLAPRPDSKIRNVPLPPKKKHPSNGKGARHGGNTVKMVILYGWFSLKRNCATKIRKKTAPSYSGDRSNGHRATVLLGDDYCRDISCNGADCDHCGCDVQEVWETQRNRSVHCVHRRSVSLAPPPPVLPLPKKRAVSRQGSNQTSESASHDSDRNEKSNEMNTRKSERHRKT